MSETGKVASWGMARIVEVVAAVIEHEGRILIGQRKPSGRHALKWEFPGGKVEPGEELKAALHRELREEIGADNFFLFGLSAQEVQARKAEGYRPMDYYAANAHLREVIDLIRGGYFSRGDTELFKPLMDNLLYYDPYMLFADFASYLECQSRVSEVYRDHERWTRMSILNTARSGKFSSDRTIREYCEDIWQAHTVSVPLIRQSALQLGVGHENKVA